MSQEELGTLLQVGNEMLQQRTLPGGQVEVLHPLDVRWMTRTEYEHLKEWESAWDAMLHRHSRERRILDEIVFGKTGENMSREERTQVVGIVLAAQRAEWFEKTTPEWRARNSGF